MYNVSKLCFNQITFLYFVAKLFCAYFIINICINKLSILICKTKINYVESNNISLFCRSFILITSYYKYMRNLPT